jgi:hypothetical protein
MGGYFSSVRDADVPSDVLLKSQLGTQSAPKWSISNIKINRHEDILGKGVEAITVTAEDVSNGYEGSIVKILAGDLVTQITDADSGISIYRLRLNEVADGVLSISLPDGVKNVHVIAEKENVELPVWSENNKKIKFNSAWGFLPSSKEYVVTLVYEDELQAQAPLSENVVLEIVNYSEPVRACIMNFNCITYE